MQRKSFPTTYSNLIGLTGKPGSGKSEVSRILTQKYNFQLIDTKDKLRMICSEITGIPYSTFQNTAGKASLYQGITLRELMGEVANSIENILGFDYFPKEALKQYKGGWAVVDSLRKDQALAFGGKIVEVTSRRSLKSNFSFDKYDRSLIHYKLVNNGDLGDLEDNIKVMLETMK